jgi:16S rRNA (guanine966-N2)-methyltransferase
LVRITGGELRGRRLHGPASRHLRPALERPREAIFNILRDRMSGARVLDAFAGAGLLGLECLSRGAAHVAFVEVHRPTAERLQATLDEWGLADRARVRRGDFLRLAGALAAEGPYDVIFVDPPYPLDLVGSSLETIAARRLLAADGRVVVKEHRKKNLSPPPALATIDERLYGDSKVTFLTWSATEER